jgi:hypothetical protein
MDLQRAVQLGWWVQLMVRQRALRSAHQLAYQKAKWWEYRRATLLERCLEFPSENTKAQQLV